MLVLAESFFVLLNLVSGFIVYLLVLKLQCHEISYFFLIFGYFILFLDPFEILSHHPTADCPRCVRDKVQRMIDRVFREELRIGIASTYSSVIFLLNFWFLPVSVFVFIVNNLLYGFSDVI